MEYRVTWEIDIEAKSPEDAVAAARAIQLDPTAWATVFNVDGVEHDLCTACGKWFRTNADGYDGMCGPCADKQEEERTQ